MTLVSDENLTGKEEAAIDRSEELLANFPFFVIEEGSLFASSCAVFTEMPKILGVLQHPQAPTCLRPCVYLYIEPSIHVYCSHMICILGTCVQFT